QAGRPLTLLVMTRDQRRSQVLTADESTGATTLVFEDTDDHWVEIVPGAPRWLDDGRLVTVADREGWRRVLLDGQTITPDGMHVRSIVHVGTDIVFTASHDEPEDCWLWRFRTGDDQFSPFASNITGDHGWHNGVVGADTMVIWSSTMRDDFRAEVWVG